MAFLVMYRAHTKGKRFSASVYTSLFNAFECHCHRVWTLRTWPLCVGLCLQDDEFHGRNDFTTTAIHILK